jgi:hypothetical protein
MIKKILILLLISNLLSCAKKNREVLKVYTKTKNVILNIEEEDKEFRFTIGNLTKNDIAINFDNEKIELICNQNKYKIKIYRPSIVGSDISPYISLRANQISSVKISIDNFKYENIKNCQINFKENYYEKAIILDDRYTQEQRREISQDYINGKRNEKMLISK